MENVIIVLVIAVLAFFGIRETVKHFKGQGECCGGGGYTPKKKKLKNVAFQKSFKVDGMKCENCKNRVMEAVNDIDHVSAKVDLKKGMMTVSYEEDVADEVIIAKLKRVGYEAAVI